MKKALFVAGAVLFLVACSSASSDDHVGSSAAQLSEVACSFRAITSPNGTTLSSYQRDCGISQTSANASYGYMNCTSAYIWEISQVTDDDDCIDDRVINIQVVPASLPADETDCENTHVGLYLYGVDPDGPYNWTSVTYPNFDAIYGTWVVDGMFSYCDFSTAVIDNVDLDNFPNGGSTVSTEGIRIVTQAFNDTTEVEVSAYISPTSADFNNCCIGQP